jgi:hypothetical protein|tara:strand:- start:213 stop:395 length:183 start_codon:yes stop_codon:yes gene_type:complete
MIENTVKHRRRLARMVVKSMDMESLVLFAQAALEVDYEESDDAYFQCDAQNYDLKGVLAK